MGKDTAPELRIDHVPIDSLRPDPANPRRISDAELEALTRSIQHFGLVDPIIARHDDKIVTPRGEGVSQSLQPYRPGAGGSVTRVAAKNGRVGSSGGR